MITSITEDILVVFLTLIGIATLIILPRHKYLWTFFSLIVIGCIHSIFSGLLALDTYWDLPTTRPFGNDSTYIFSMVCFMVTATVITAEVILEHKSTRIYFAAYMTFSLMFIVFTQKLLTKCTTNHEFELSEFLHCSRTLELKLWNMTVPFCSNIVYFSLIGPLMEYIVMYIPMWVIFYMKIYRHTKTFNDWWSLPSKEDCPGCQLNVSLSHHIIMFFFVVIWLIRPLNFIIDRFTFSVRNNDIIPMISMLTLYVSTVFYIVKYYCYEKGCLNKKSFNVDCIDKV